MATYIPSGLLAICWVFFAKTPALLCWLTVLLAIATVSATAMIYVSLKPIPRWNNIFVLPNYLLLGLGSAAIWLAAIATLRFEQHALLLVACDWLAVIALALAALGKLAYWRFIDSHHGASTPESATGLGKIGKVKLFAAPHTEENYLLKEMGYRVARKHAVKLRLIALGLGFSLPAISAFAAIYAPGWPAAILLLVAAAGNAVGTLTERWLFFAEARHAVTLFYGGDFI